MQIRKIHEYQLNKNLKYFRKIHIYRNIWLISVRATRTIDGRFPINYKNCLYYLLSFVFVPVKIINWED